MATDPPLRHDEWSTATVQHEGCPLALRVRTHADTPEHRARWPRLAIVTHTLAVVRADGLPDARYNDTLADFDEDVIRTLEGGDDGIVALVETFAGERSYYAYVVGPGRATAAVRQLESKYPEHKLIASGSPDPDWKLYADYRKRWPW